MTRRLKLTIAYDGTHYSGWQRQPNKRTLQETIENAFRDYTDREVPLVASGRTDAGVHALGQVASCQFPLDHSLVVIQRAVNFRLPLDIRILRVEDVASDFHAISSATRKRYRYQIEDVEIGDIFQRNHVWHLPKPLNIDAMIEAASYLVGRHDFSSFQAAGAQRKTSVRTIHQLDVIRRDTSPRLWLEVTADGFLYNMVRIICGSLVQVGKGKEPPQWIARALAAADRSAAGPTAPSQGLFLVQVWYE
jgi:tRNA pseudouridine38-40 synthase